MPWCCGSDLCGARLIAGKDLFSLELRIKTRLRLCQKNVRQIAVNTGTGQMCLSFFFLFFFYWNTLLCELNGGVSHTFLFYVPRLSSFPNCLTTFITWCLLSFWNSHQFFKITRRYVKTNPSLSVCRTCYNTMSRAWMSWANGKDKSCCFWRFCFQRSNCLHLWVQQNSEELKEKFFFSDSDSVALKKKSLNVDSNVDHDPLAINRVC